MPGLIVPSRPIVPPRPHAWLHLDGRAIDPDRWKTAFTVAKWHPKTVLGVQHDLLGGREPVGIDFHMHGVKPDDWAHEETPNLLTTAGLALLTSLFEGNGGNPFNHSDAFVGVGSSSTAATVSDAHLGGDGSSTTAWYQQADSGYPTQSGGLISCYCTIGSSNGNFPWNEYGFGDGTSISAGSTFSSVSTGGVFINHKVPGTSLGTKGSGAIWQAQGTITES